MRKNVQNIFAIILCCFLTISITACGSQSKTNSTVNKFASSGSIAETVASSAMDTDFGFNESSKLEENDILNKPESEQKLVYTTNLTIETKNFDNSKSEILKTVSEMGGYVENTDLNSYSGSNRYADYTIRIPVEKYREFLTAAGSVGSIRHQNESVEDITANYLDVTARLNSLNDKMDMLKDLQEQAENLDQLLQIENQISSTQYEIESYTSQLKYMNNQVSYCTVNISLIEVELYTEKPTFGNKVIDAVKGSCSGFINFLQGLFISIIYIIPYLLVIIPAGLLIKSFCTKHTRPKPKKNDLNKTISQNDNKIEENKKNKT